MRTMIGAVWFAFSVWPSNAIWFAIFLVVLIVRPAGLLGQVGAEEVGFREQS